MNALTFQTFYNLFLGIQISPASDGKRMFRKKICQYLLCCFFSIGFQPPGYQHLWHGILYRKIFQQIIFFLRKPDLIHFPGYGTKNTVYKRLQIIKAFSLRQLHSLIAHCTVRNTVHKFQLIYRTSQDLTDLRFHLVYRNLGKRIDDIINIDPVFQGSLTYSCNKTTFLFRKELIFGKRIPDRNIAVLTLLLDL